MIIELTDINCPEAAVFASLTERQLRSEIAPEKALIVVESPKVIRVALQQGLQPTALLCERRHISGDAADIIAAAPQMPVYTADRDLLRNLTGYTLTRGVLCAMRRPSERSAADVTTGARLVAVIDAVTDTTNIGAIFRSAAALGVDAVLLTRQSCDPLNRRSIRVSMGSVFLVPWAWIDDPIADLRRLGIASVAMALRSDSIPVDSPVLAALPRVGLILGTEGDGLGDRVIEGADYVTRIPMSHSVDSLNVAAASAVAFWQLRQ